MNDLIARFIPNLVTEVNNDMLTRISSIKKVALVVFDMHGLLSLRPNGNGFAECFYQEY